MYVSTGRWHSAGSRAVCDDSVKRKKHETKVSEKLMGEKRESKSYCSTDED